MTAPGKAGHAAIWNEVVRNRRLIRAVLWRSGVLANDIDDLEQNCMLVAWRAIQEDRFNPSDPMKPLAENGAAWLAGIAHWTAIEHKRVQARRAKLFSSGPTAEHPIDVDAVAVPSPEARVEAKEELAAIARMKMNPKQREAVMMAAEGYSAREIGERLGVPEETAASYLRRVRVAWEKATAKRRHR